MSTISASSAVEFDLGFISQVPLRGQLRLLDIGGHETARTTITPDDIEEAEQDCLRWAIDIGLADASSSYFAKFRRARVASLSALSLPDVEPRRAKCFIYLQTFMFVLDDVLDNVVDIRTGDHYINYGQLAKVFDAFMVALSEGRACRGRDLPAGLGFPLFDAFVDALLCVRQLALESGQDVSWFIASLQDYFDALAWEHGAHTVRAYIPTQSTYVCNREQTISYIPSIESFLLIKKIVLPRELRQRHPMKLLLTNACRHVILINDMFSLAKEIAHEELDNALLLDRRGGGAGLQRRFESLLEWTNTLAADVAHIARGLTEAFPGDRDVADYVTTIVNSINGHVAWYAASERYGRFVLSPVPPTQTDGRVH